MNTIVVVTFVFCLLSTIAAYQVVHDEENNEYFLIPARQKRQTNWKVESANPGTRVTLQHQGTLLNQNGHRLDGMGMVSKQFRPSGPLTTGAGLAYQHIPSGSNLNVNAQHTPRFGTDLSASGTANLWRAQRGNSRLDAVGTYSRHYGGMWGTQHPDYYGGLKFTHRF